MLRGVLLGIGLMVGCGGGPSESDCKKLAAHLVDLELRERGTEGDAEARAKLEAEATEANMKFCLDKLPSDQVSCGLKAKSVAEVEACDK